MSIQLEDSVSPPLSQWETSEVLLLPIDQRRLEDPAYNQYIREMYHFARTYNKRMLGVLLENCAYQSHPVLSKISVITPDESGSNRRLSQMAKQALSASYESFSLSWEAVVEKLDSLTQIEQKALRPKVKARLFYDTTAQIWKIDKGRPDGLSVWHSPLEVKTETGDNLALELHQVLDNHALVSHFEGDQAQTYTLHIPPRAEEKIKVYIQDHGHHPELIQAIQQLMSGYERLQWVNEPRIEGMVLHLEADRAWLAGTVNPFQPFARPIAMTAADLPVQMATQLHQIIDWEWLLRWETNQTGTQALDMSLMARVNGEWKPWGRERIFVWEMENASDRYELALELKNTHEKDLYYAVFQMRDDIHIKRLNWENQLLRAGDTALIPLDSVYLLPHTIPYNWPVSGVNIRVLASEQELRMQIFETPNLPLLPLPGGMDDTMTATLQIRDKAPNIQYDQLLSISLLNPEYNSAKADPLRAMLEDYHTQYFAKGIYLRTTTLDARYPLREHIQFDADSKTPLPAFYGRLYEPPIEKVLENMRQYLPAKLRATSKPLLIGIGDTWLNHSESIDLVAQLADDFTTFSIPVQNFAHIRHAVEAVAALEGLDAMPYHLSNVESSNIEQATLPPGEKWLLLSPMGERVFNRSMAELLSGKALDKENPLAAFSDTFFRRMDDLEEEWRGIFAFVTKFLPDFSVLVHNYSQFILEKDNDLIIEIEGKGLTKYQADEILGMMIDIFENRLTRILNKYPEIRFAAIQDEVPEDEWNTTFVPNNKGFSRYFTWLNNYIQTMNFPDLTDWLLRLDYISWNEALVSNTIEKFESFILDYPESQYRTLAENKIADLSAKINPEDIFQKGKEAEKFSKSELEEQATWIITDNKEITNTLYYLIAQGSLEKALDILAYLLKYDKINLDAVLLLQSSFHEMNLQKKAGVIPLGELLNGLKKISNELILLIKKVEFDGKFFPVHEYYVPEKKAVFPINKPLEEIKSDLQALLKVGDNEKLFNLLYLSIKESSVYFPDFILLFNSYSLNKQEVEPAFASQGFLENMNKISNSLLRFLENLKESHLLFQDPFEDLMVFVEGGRFMMGDESIVNSRPVHEVTVPDFYLCKFPVTQAQWEMVMGNNPSAFKGCSDCPVESISWNDAKIFLEILNAKTGKNYRLPSEAEWQYASQGGRYSQGYKYAGSDYINQVAWYNENSELKTHSVGLKAQNELGLFDMNGNVSEWCEDDWHENYEGSPMDGSAWVNKPTRNKIRVVNGGGYSYREERLKIKLRHNNDPDVGWGGLGFRIAQTSFSG